MKVKPVLVLKIESHPISAFYFQSKTDKSPEISSSNMLFAID